MRRRLIWLLAGGSIALVLAAAAGAGGSATGPRSIKPTVGGTLTFGAEQEPPGLNIVLTCCTAFWGQVTAITPVLKGAFQQQPDLSYKEDLVTKVDEVRKPFTLTYHIKPEAKWSDGTPVSAQDFIFTWQTYINKAWDVANRTGYLSIYRAKAIDQKTVRFFFKEPFAGWRANIFTNTSPVLPKHALQGEDFNKVWLNAIVNPKTGDPIGDGPFLVQQWQKGQSLTLVRNPNYWGPHKAYLDKIVFRFITDTNSEIQAIRGSEVDAVYPQPQLALADLSSQSGLKIQSSAGPTIEHIDFQMGPHAGPLEKAPWVRQALAYAVDRGDATTSLFKTLTPKLPVLNSLLYASNQKEYQPHFQTYTFSPAKVAALMQKHKCTKGSDGIWVCQGQRMSFSFTSTAGNKLRELYFEVVQAKAKEAGIELTSGFGPARIVFGPTVFAAGNFQTFMYAWVTNGDPQNWLPIYNCADSHGDQNFKGYCSRKVTKLLTQSQAEFDPAKRAALVNKADAIMALTLPALPLYQKPTFFVYTTKLHNAIDNPTNTGPTWNAGEWWLG